MRTLIRSCWLALALSSAAGAGELQTLNLNADFQTAGEALRDAIEGAGLVVTAVMPVNQMLVRTAGDLGQGKSPFSDAETIQFCSARLAWELVSEDAAQLAFCPLALTLYRQPGGVGSVIAWRSPGRASPARIRGDDLLRNLANQARRLAD
jgi:uncharacterized protein (DUF302 family)